MEKEINLLKGRCVDCEWFHWRSWHAGCFFENTYRKWLNQKTIFDFKFCPNYRPSNDTEKLLKYADKVGKKFVLRFLEHLIKNEKLRIEFIKEFGKNEV